MLSRLLPQWLTGRGVAGWRVQLWAPFVILLALAVPGVALMVVNVGCGQIPATSTPSTPNATTIPVQATPTPSPASVGNSVTMVPPTIDVPKDIQRAVYDVLVNGRSVIPAAAKYFAITSGWQQEGWASYSVAGLDHVGKNLDDWNIQDNGVWFSNVLLHQGENGQWSGAISDTREFFDLLDQVPDHIISAEVKRSLHSTAAE